MNAGYRSARRLALGSDYLSGDTVCASCFHRLSTQGRRHAATAAATIEEASPTLHNAPPPPVTHAGPRKAYRVLASTVLSRPPLLTRELTSFEKAFYLYQKRLNERLVLPFTRYFYFKKGTPADLEWKRKFRARKSAARDIGVYSGYGDQAWNDELLIGDETPEPSNQIEALIRDAEGKPIIDVEPVGNSETEGKAIGDDTKDGDAMLQQFAKEVVIEKPMPRLSEADTSNDLKSLSRKMDRILYLLVKGNDGRWKFPEARIKKKESLAQAAERVLVESCGINMNTWIVGNHPVGFHEYTFPWPETKSEQSQSNEKALSKGRLEPKEIGEKTFFMKGRIMAGQADLSANEFGDQEFHWLAKEEIQQRVLPKYWSSIQNMLTER